jgi:hypothetical protein
MTRRKKDSLRTLTEEERNWLELISRSQSEPAAHVAHAKAILAVAEVAVIPRQRKRQAGNQEMQYHNWSSGPIEKVWQLFTPGMGVGRK